MEDEFNELFSSEDLGVIALALYEDGVSDEQMGKSLRRFARAFGVIRSGDIAVDRVNIEEERNANGT